MTSLLYFIFSLGARLGRLEEIFIFSIFVAELIWFYLVLPGHFALRSNIFCHSCDNPALILHASRI